MASELINILVANHQHRRVFRHARFNSRASFMRQISRLPPCHLECASEDDAFTNERPITIAFASNWSARADAALAALNPLFYIEAGFFNRSQ